MMAKILWDTIFLISGTFSLSLVLNGSLFTFGTGYRNSTITDASIPLQINSTALLNLSTNTSAELSESITSHTTTITTSTTNGTPVKKSVAAAVRSHFDDCPDSHRHFCFHGTCRFLILEDTPACVCHQGFVGIRCEHADLLAVVATDHRQLTIAPLLASCVILCVFIAALSTLLHCWWRQRCRRRRHAHHDTSEKTCGVLKHGVPYCPSESVV